MKQTEIRKNNDGSALIVATVASVVLMTFSLMLLLVSYSLFSSVNEQKLDIAARELCFSIADELTQQLTVEYDTADRQIAVLESKENPLWIFIRFNLCQGSDVWAPVDLSEFRTEEGNLDINGNPMSSDEIKRKKKQIIDEKSKFFTITDSNKVADDVKIQMYWEEANTSDYSDSMLHVLVTVSNKEVVYESERSYILNVFQYEGNFPEEDDLSDAISDSEITTDEPDPEDGTGEIPNVPDEEPEYDDPDELIESFTDANLNPRDTRIKKFVHWRWDVYD